MASALAVAASPATGLACWLDQLSIGYRLYGRLGARDAVLLRSGKLDAAEWKIMKAHTTIGARMLHNSPSDPLWMAETLALSHHEHWDGPGYPNGIAGEAIPLVGRIGAVADVFDALTSDRPYRRALPNPTAYEMMAAERGGGISIPGFSTSSSRSARR